MTVQIQIDPSLRFLLPIRHRHGVVSVRADENSSLGHVVEALGVPRTEFGQLLVNGVATEPSARLSDGDVVDVPARSRPQPVGQQGFLLDVHLGTLARRMRLLGIDVAYRNDADDDELVVQAIEENRVLLTQDRGLLRRRAVPVGGYVRGSDPEDQLADVLDRFTPTLRPWSRCPACNGALESVAKDEIEHLLPSGTRRSYTDFSRCPACARLYWRGAHNAHLEAIVATSDR